MSVIYINLFAFAMYFVAEVNCLPLNNQNMMIQKANITGFHGHSAQNIRPLCHIEIPERIQKCKITYPQFDYDILDENDKGILNHQENVNPCRTDCVLYTPPKKCDNHYCDNRKRQINTVFFTDSRPCAPDKVCKYRNGVGVCVKG